MIRNKGCSKKPAGETPSVTVRRLSAEIKIAKSSERLVVSCAIPTRHLENFEGQLLVPCLTKDIQSHVQYRCLVYQIFQHSGRNIAQSTCHTLQMHSSPDERDFSVDFILRFLLHKKNCQQMMNAIH